MLWLISVCILLVVFPATQWVHLVAKDEDVKLAVDSNYTVILCAVAADYLKTRLKTFINLNAFNNLNGYKLCCT